MILATQYNITCVLCLVFVIIIYKLASDPNPEPFDGGSMIALIDDTSFMDGMSGTGSMNYLDNIVKAQGLSGRLIVSGHTKPLTHTKPPITTSRFKMTSSESVRYIYKLLYILDKILHQNNIEYWIDGGTLLGAVRHGGLIPWDDDGDIEIWKKDEEKFKQLENIFASYDINLVPVWFGYKIFFNNGKPIEGYTWKYPFIDIFIMEEKNGYVMYSYPKAQNIFGKCHFEKNTMYPLERYRFGSIELTGVSRRAVKKYFDTCYGKDWSTHAYQMYNHENEKSIKQEKVLLSEDEKKPAQPVDCVEF